MRKQAAEEAAVAAAAAAEAAGPVPERTGSPAGTSPTLELPQMEALHGDLFVDFKHEFVFDRKHGNKLSLLTGAGQEANLRESGRGRRAGDTAL